MSKTPFNIQDQYLNQARKERVRVNIIMMSGDKLDGFIKSFDSFLCADRKQGGSAAVQACDFLDYLGGWIVPIARWSRLIVIEKAPIRSRGSC